ncbi:MAG: Hsp20/alpha crystallin family protein [Candidatus Omnitrophota bacterium]
MGKKVIYTAMLSGWLLLSSGLSAYPEEDVNELKRQIEVLKKRVEELEAIKTRPVVGISRVRMNPSDTVDEDPFVDMERFQEEMDQTFQKSLNLSNQPGSGIVSSMMNFDTNLDFRENEDGYIITFNMTGLDQDKIDVQINEHSITLKGEQTLRNEQKNPNGYSQSQAYGSFMKTVPLPEDADVTKIKTEKETGRLVIKIPRKNP